MSNAKTSLTLSVRRTRKPGIRTNVNTGRIQAALADDGPSIKDTSGGGSRQSLSAGSNYA